MNGTPAGSALWDVLRIGAVLECTPDECRHLARAAARMTAWPQLAAEADAHGIAPLLLHNLKRSGVSMPRDAEHHLAAISARHRAANRAHFQALSEILHAFDKSGIPMLVLKGAALAHLLYPDSALRPLGDLDLLIEATAAEPAQRILHTIGFSKPRRNEGATHHHLPGMTRVSDAGVTTVELHTDALSLDTGASLSLATMSDPGQSFQIEGQTARAFGHLDMLYHLCRHAAEYAEHFRLVWASDIVGYAAKYSRVIAWDDLRARRPFVINALSLLHLVTPLPLELATHVTPAGGAALRGVGVSCKPLSTIFRRRRPLHDMWLDLFDPSDWWIRLHYGLDEQARLAWHRTVAHPLRVASLLARRARTARVGTRVAG